MIQVKALIFIIIGKAKSVTHVHNENSVHARNPNNVNFPSRLPSTHHFRSYCHLPCLLPSSPSCLSTTLPSPESLLLRLFWPGCQLTNSNQLSPQGTWGRVEIRRVGGWKGELGASDSRKMEWRADLSAPCSEWAQQIFSGWQWSLCCLCLFSPLTRHRFSTPGLETQRG